MDGADNKSKTEHSLMPKTRWTWVVDYQNGGTLVSKKAMESICRIYYRPIFLYIRTFCRVTDDEALDLTQEYFRQLVRRDFLSRVDREKGRLRWFLFRTIRFFLINEWKRKTLPLGEVEDLEGTVASDEPEPDIEFDRAWARALVEGVYESLEEEYRKNGRHTIYDVLRTSIPWRSGDSSYANLAGELGLAVGSIKREVHTLRKRFKEILLAHVNETVGSEAAAEEEVRYLWSLFES